MFTVATNRTKDTIPEMYIFWKNKKIANTKINIPTIEVTAGSANHVCTFVHVDARPRASPVPDANASTC